MTIVQILGNSCGFESRISVECLDRFLVRVRVISDCKMAQDWGNQLKELDWRKALGKISDSPVFTLAESCLRHSSCPLPTALLKAIEVELGISIASDLELKFHNEPGKIH